MAGKKTRASIRKKNRKSADRGLDSGFPRRRYVAYVLICVVSLAIGATSVMMGFPYDPRRSDEEGSSAAWGLSQRLGALSSAGPDELAGMDIAEMNLLCAAGLPGAEEIDIDKILARLDSWADTVKSETKRNWRNFVDNPGKYRDSEAYFRAMMLVTVLQQDLGVQYNLKRVRDVDFKRSVDLFIHGMLSSDNGGTCVSMPVLYVAVGRRLGYPLKLVRAKAHVFLRWDSPDGQRFNIEATNKGMHSFDDEYYKTWPKKMTPREIAAGMYLKSLGPAEELALFYAIRGHCLLDTGRTREAQIAYAHSHNLDPRNPMGLAYLVNAVRRESTGTAGRNGAADQVAVGRIGSSGRKMKKERDPLVELRRIEEINARNRRMIDERNAPHSHLDLHQRTSVPRAGGPGVRPAVRPASSGYSVPSHAGHAAH